MAVNVAVAEASEAGGTVVQAEKAEKAAIEVVPETQVVTLDEAPPPRAAPVSARETSAEQGGGQVVDESQQPGRRPCQSQLVCKCQGSY